MTGRRTSHPNAGLWTATITLLLFSASVRSHSAPALNDTAPSLRATDTGSPSGSVALLRKADSIVEAAPTTLKSVGESPEASRDTVAFGEKITVDNSTNNRLVDARARDESIAKSGKLEVQKDVRVADKREAADSLPEFSEKDDDVEAHELVEENDREPTTPPSKKDVNDKNGTPTNPREKDEKSKPEGSISLANDMDVNYNGKKAVKSSKDDAVLGDESKALENATNVIASGDGADGHVEKVKGPKDQVEVVENSTLPKIQRIIDHTDGAGEGRKEVESPDADKRENNNKVPTTVIPNAEDSAGVKTRSDITRVLSEAEVEAEKTENGKTLASPRGRTISFGGTNEFVTVENNTRQNDGITDQPIANDLTKEVFQEHKTSEFKPYPYVKTATNYPLNESETRLPLPGNREVPESTEEASALENTIGQRQQDKKVVVTEPSVVIDNSIQQFKPTYYKRSGNASRIQSTVDSTSSTAAPSLESSNKETTVFVATTKSITLEKNTTDYVGNVRVSSTENDVPRGKDEETKTSIGVDVTSSGLDLTGNGITKVVLDMKNHSIPSINDADLIDDSIKSTTSIVRATDDTQVQNSTETTATLSDDPSVTNIDLQTDTENSMLKISPFNVTESSTRIPSTESFTSFPTTTAMPTTDAMTSSSSRSTEREHSVTTIIPEVSTDFLTRETLQSDESTTVEPVVETTTSKIEYEFVGLTESTVSQKYIATTDSANAVTADKEDASSTASSSTEFLTASRPASIPEISTTLDGSSIDGITTEEATTSYTETSTEAVTSMIESSTTDDSTTSLSTLDLTVPDEATTSINDNSDLTTIMDDLSTTDMNESLVTTTDEISVVTSVTSAPEISTHGNRNTTDTGRAADSSSTNVPDTSDTQSGISENPADASIDSTESTIPSIATDHPRVIETTKRPEVESISIVPSTEAITTQEPEITSTSPEPTNNAASIPTTRRGAIPSLVRIVFEGLWADVCPHLPALRQSLAELLASGLDRTVLAIQIIYQKNPCTDGYAATSTESSGTSLLLYVVDQKGNFDEEMTKMLPALYSKSPIKLQVTITSFQLVQDSDSGNAIAVVVVSCVAFICLVLLAGLLFIMRKRQTRFNYGERCRPVSLDAYSLDSVSAYNSVRRKGAARASKRSYGNPTFEDSSAIPSHPLNFGGLATFCNEQNAISEEFSGIPQVTARIDELPPGAEVKNRYANVVPLPETRVSLMKINNDPLTEYINASYVRGPKNATKYYIACQAPIESTVTDFWRMIWEQQSKVIIMLTDLVENGVEKCAEYIPPSEVTDCHRLFGDFQVTLKKRETKEKYAISTLHLKNLENNTFREISHIWYLWPANGVQSDAAGLIAVLLEARALQRGGPGPIVVHCSPGTGRTGTLIALDLGIRQYEITRTVDVPRVVYTIRRDRAGAVQTKEQYAFIYKALNLYATKLAGGALES